MRLFGPGGSQTRKSCSRFRGTKNANTVAFLGMKSRDYMILQTRQSPNTQPLGIARSTAVSWSVVRYAHVGGCTSGTVLQSATLLRGHNSSIVRMDKQERLLASTLHENALP